MDVRLQVWVPRRLYDAAARVAVSEGKTLSEWVRELLEAATTRLVP